MRSLERWTLCFRLFPKENLIMLYKLLLTAFGLITLGLLAFIGNTLLRAHRRYVLQFMTKRQKNKKSHRNSSHPESDTVPRPLFLLWWLKQYSLLLSAACGAYLLIIAGAYVVSPLLRYGAKIDHAAADIPVMSVEQKELWRSYVELSLIAEKNSQDAPTHLQLARTQRDLGLTQKSLATYHKVLYLDPLSIDARFELGCLATVAGEIPLAVTQVEELAHRWPRRPESSLLQARIDFHAGKKAEALTEVRRALAVDPKNRRVRLLLVELLFQQRAYVEAVGLAEEGLKPAPCRVDQTVNAMEELRTTSGETVTAILLLLARSQAALGRYAEAYATFQTAAQTDTATPAPFILLADLRIQRGEYRAALAASEEALRRDPENQLIMNNIACLSVEHGFDLGRAANLAARMYARFPADPAVADTLGWVLLAQGKGAQALPLLRFAVIGAPLNPTHHYHYGAALLKTGQTVEGRKELGAALKLSRDFDGAARARLLSEGKG